MVKILIKIGPKICVNTKTVFPYKFFFFLDFERRSERNAWVKNHDIYPWKLIVDQKTTDWEKAISIAIYIQQDYPFTSNMVFYRQLYGSNEIVSS